MRSLSNDLKLLLANRQVLRCNAYTITLINGVVLRYTDADVDITVGGVTWSSLGPKISGGRFSIKRGLEVARQTVQILHSASDTVNGMSWHQAARIGGLDNAKFDLSKCFAATWNTTVYAVPVFSGLVRAVSHAEMTTTLEVASDAEMMQEPVPKIRFQPGCVRNLYDSGCGVSRAAFTFTGTVTATNSKSAIVVSVEKTEDYFALGYVEFLTGANAGTRRSIKASADNGLISMSIPLPSLPEIDDQVKLVAGCDRSLFGANGCNKFNNVPNFKGFPFVPNPETQY